MVAMPLALINSLVVHFGMKSVHYHLDFESDYDVDNLNENTTAYFASSSKETPEVIVENSLVIISNFAESNGLPIQKLLTQYDVWVLADVESASAIEKLPLNLESNIITPKPCPNDTIELYEWYRVNGGPLMKNKIVTWTQGELLFVDQRSKWERRNNFGGAMLKNGMRMKSPVTYDNEYILWHLQKMPKGNYQERGIMADVMQVLKNKLNFSTEIVFGPDDKYGALNPDGSWNGIVGELHKSQIDLSSAGLTITADRSRDAIDFTLGIIPDLSTLLIRPSSHDHKLQSLHIWAFITVFPPSVWLLILAGMILTSICYWTYSRSSNIRGHVDGFTMGLTLSYLILIQLGMPGSSCNVLKQLSGKVFIISFSFMAMALFAHYTGDLTAFMTVGKAKTHIKSFQVCRILGPME